MRSSSCACVRTTKISHDCPTKILENSCNNVESYTHCQYGEILDLIWPGNFGESSGKILYDIKI